jgi:hypothetical protein
VLIAVLLFSETTLEKVARHGDLPDQVRQVNDGDRIVIRNPRPRVEGSVLMIGPTHGGRILTVVLNPERLDAGAWACANRVGRERCQITRYRRDR